MLQIQCQIVPDRLWAGQGVALAQLLSQTAPNQLLSSLQPGPGVLAKAAGLRHLAAGGPEKPAQTLEASEQAGQVGAQIVV